MSVFYLVAIVLSVAAFVTGNVIPGNVSRSSYSPGAAEPLGPDVRLYSAGESHSVILFTNLTSKSLMCAVVKHKNAVDDKVGLVTLETPIQYTSIASNTSGTVTYLTPDWVSSSSSSSRVAILDTNDLVFFKVSVDKKKGLKTVKTNYVHSTSTPFPVVYKGKQRVYVWVNNAMRYYDVEKAVGRAGPQVNNGFSVPNSYVYSTNDDMIVFQSKTASTLIAVYSKDAARRIPMDKDITSVDKIACSSSSCYMLYRKAGVVNQLVKRITGTGTSKKAVQLGGTYKYFAVDDVQIPGVEPFVSILVQNDFADTIQYQTEVDLTLTDSRPLSNVWLSYRGELMRSKDIPKYQSISEGLGLAYFDATSSDHPSMYLVKNSLPGARLLTGTRSLATGECKGSSFRSKVLLPYVLWDGAQEQLTLSYFYKGTTKILSSSFVISGTPVEPSSYATFFFGATCSKKQQVDTTGFTFWTLDNVQVNSYFVRTTSFNIESVLPKLNTHNPAPLLIACGAISLLIIFCNAFSMKKNEPDTDKNGYAPM